MQIEKSEPSKDDVVPSTDKQLLPGDETVVSPDETISSTDETILAADETVSSETPSSDDTLVPDDEITSSTLDVASFPVELASPVAKTLAVPDEIVSQTEETSAPVGTLQAWRAFAKPWWQATLAILPTFLVTRFVFLLLSYFGGVLFFVKNYSLTVISLHDMLYRWYYWDAKRFTTIATNGYVTPDYAAFFPLYPTIVHVLTALTHRDVLAVSMFVSNIAFLGMLIVLYRFVTVEFDKETAQRSVLYISIFPTALFFFAGYNESLFLLFTLLCFYTVRRGSWWLAGFFGLLASLTRSSGIFLALVFVLEYLRQNWPTLRAEWQSKDPARLVRPLANLSAVVLIPLGVGIYALALYRRFHNPLEFIAAQSNWRQGLTFPLYAPLDTLKKIATLPLFTFVTPHNIIDLTAAVLFAALIVMCFVGPYRLERSQWTLPLFSILILVTTMLYPNLPNFHGWYDPLASTQRLVLEAFVGFIILARLGRKAWFHQLYLLISLPLLAFLTLQFMTGHWTV
jgi:Gpi18-like mannosyltransferase